MDLFLWNFFVNVRGFWLEVKTGGLTTHLARSVSLNVSVSFYFVRLLEGLLLSYLNVTSLWCNALDGDLLSERIQLLEVSRGSLLD